MGASENVKYPVTICPVVIPAIAAGVLAETFVEIPRNELVMVPAHAGETTPALIGRINAGIIADA